MEQTFTASVWKEGDWYVAQCLQVEVAGQGRTQEEALDNLSEALRLHFAAPVAMLLAEVDSTDEDAHAV